MESSTWTAGIDLAAQPDRTSICSITWSARGGTVHDLIETSATDCEILTILGSADFVGIDCPFGWPDRFVEAIGRHALHADWPDRGAPGDERRESLRLRATDLYVREVCGITPLSVSSNLIGVVAMRWAGLLDAHSVDKGVSVDRAGGGPLFEIYPACALKRWGLPFNGYKGSIADDTKRAVRETVVDNVREALPFLTISDENDRILRVNHDALDALICTLVTRAAHLGLVEPIPSQHRDAASREGWILMPRRDALDGLAG